MWLRVRSPHVTSPFLTSQFLLKLFFRLFPYATRLLELYVSLHRSYDLVVIHEKIEMFIHIMVYLFLRWSDILMLLFCSVLPKMHWMFNVKKRGRFVSTALLLSSFKVNGRFSANTHIWAPCRYRLPFLRLLILIFTIVAGSVSSGCCNTKFEVH